MKRIHFVLHKALKTAFKFLESTVQKVAPQGNEGRLSLGVNKQEPAERNKHDRVDEVYIVTTLHPFQGECTGNWMGNTVHQQNPSW